jgi:hypothetical protein
MTEGRVTEVVGKRKRLGQVFVQTERASKRAGDLGHLQGMGKAGSVVVTLMIDKYLSFVL